VTYYVFICLSPAFDEQKESDSGGLYLYNRCKYAKKQMAQPKQVLSLQYVYAYLIFLLSGLDWPLRRLS
jgi:hypothetical protein